MGRLLLAAIVALALVGCAAQSRTPSPTEGSTMPLPSPNPSASASSWDELPEPIPHDPAASPSTELREELLARMAEDQAVRTGIAPPGDDRTADELFAAIDQVDAANADRMREILDQYGWPGWSLVGEEGALAAWVLIQHADLGPDLQERGLAMLRGAVEANDASPGDLAYLIDRYLVGKGLPQLYGTQLGAGPDGELAPQTPIEDEANVDERRAAAGLGTLDEYFEEFRRAMEEPEPGSSP